MYLQTYIQLATERSEEIIQNMKVKEREIELWIFRNNLPNDIKMEIMPIVQHMWEEKTDVDVQNLLSHLPFVLLRNIKRLICLPMLREVSPQSLSPPLFIYFWRSSSFLNKYIYRIVKVLQRCQISHLFVTS
jgi:hypothetical protein